MSESGGDLARRTDDELATLALEGDAEAWNEAVRRHTHRVVVRLLARGVPLAAAEDFVQEAWVRLVERQRSGTLKTLRLPGLATAQAEWLAREAGRTERRRADILRKAIGSNGDPDVSGFTGLGPDPERLAAERERVEAIQEELARCPPRARQVFYAVYGPGAASHATVARELGLSTQRVRQILAETRSRLRGVLVRLEGVDDEWNT